MRFKRNDLFYVNEKKINKSNLIKLKIHFRGFYMIKSLKKQSVPVLRRVILDFSRKCNLKSFSKNFSDQLSLEKKAKFTKNHDFSVFFT